MKNAFDGLIRRLDTAIEELFRIWEYVNRNIQNWKVKRKDFKKKKRLDYLRTIRQLQNYWLSKNFRWISNFNKRIQFPPALVLQIERKLSATMSGC